MTRPWQIALALAGVYVVLALAGLCWGAAFISPQQVLECFLGGGSERDRLLVLQVRCPQLILLGLVGAALACSGATLQATFDNPLADPSVLGVSSGASLAALLAMDSGLTDRLFLALPTATFLGALVAALLVYALTFLRGRPSLHALLLTGVAVSSLASAGVTLVMTLTEAYRIQELLFWLMGGVKNISWEQLGTSAPGMILGVTLMLGMHRRLDALLLGEEQALAVGVPVTATRLQVLAATSLATGAAVAVSGAVGFVGLMVPHLVRRLVGPRSLHLLPACVTGGAAFLTGCDLITRIRIAPIPIQLGVVTAFLGAPAFLFLLRRGEENRT